MKTYLPSEIQAALAMLAQCEGNASEAARRLGMPRRTLVYWAKQHGVRGAVVNAETGKVEQRKGTATDAEKAAKEWDRAWKLNALEMANPDKVAKATLRDNTIAAGTAYDKFRLTTGASTANVKWTLVDVLTGHAPPDVGQAMVRRWDEERPAYEAEVKARAEEGRALEEQYRLKYGPLTTPSIEAKARVIDSEDRAS